MTISANQLATDLRAMIERVNRDEDGCIAASVVLMASAADMLEGMVVALDRDTKPLGKPHPLPATAPPPVMDNNAAGILKEALHSMVFRGVPEVKGPPNAYFETGEGPTAYRWFYQAYDYGVPIDAMKTRNAVGVYGHFTTFAELLEVVCKDLAKRVVPGKPIVWRTYPEVEIERGHYKAYMRFVEVDTQEQADQAVAAAKQMAEAQATGYSEKV